MHKCVYPKIMKYLRRGSKYPLVCAFEDPITLRRIALPTMQSERLASGMDGAPVTLHQPVASVYLTS